MTAWEANRCHVGNIRPVFVFVVFHPSSCRVVIVFLAGFLCRLKTKPESKQCISKSMHRGCAFCKKGKDQRKISLRKETECWIPWVYQSFKAAAIRRMFAKGSPLLKIGPCIWALPFGGAGVVNGCPDGLLPFFSNFLFRGFQNTRQNGLCTF